MKVVLCVVIALLGLVCARPQKRSELLGSVLAAAGDEDMLREYLKDKTPEEIRADVAHVNNDINGVLDFLDKAQRTIMFKMEAGEVRPTEEGNQVFGQLGQFVKNLKFDMNSLPPFPEEGQAVFIDKCIQRAREYDFNQAADEADFANTFLDHIFECFIDGVEVLEGMSDLSDVDDADLTPENILGSMEIVEQTGNELIHLVAFASRKFEQGKNAQEGQFKDYNDFVKGDMKKRNFLDVLRERKTAKLMSALNKFLN